MFDLAVLTTSYNIMSGSRRDKVKSLDCNAVDRKLESSPNYSCNTD